MARVNHKKVKQLLSEKRSKITDRQFFTSRILALHFEDMAMAQTCGISITAASMSISPGNQRTHRLPARTTFLYLSMQGTKW